MYLTLYFRKIILKGIYGFGNIFQDDYSQIKF